jgi:hypothetical protein
MPGVVKEGWYEDPASRHEYRWFSAGTPTDLVRDGAVTSRDALSMASPALYTSMDLAEPPDNWPPAAHAERREATVRGAELRCRAGRDGQHGRRHRQLLAGVD